MTSRPVASSPIAAPAGSARLLLGRPLADAEGERIRGRVERWRGRGLAPRLAVVVASTDPAVLAYAEVKTRAAAKLGVMLALIRVDPGDGQAGLDGTIERLSADRATHGIILELPVAPGLDAERALAWLDPKKDVDGLTPANLGQLAAGNERAALASATPLACLMLAEQATTLRARRAVVIGRGRTVGRPLAAMLTNRDATVTLCHSRTADLAGAIAAAELVFCAAGRPGLLTPALVRPGQVVIDAGTTMVAGKLAGDADPAIAGIVAALTPVPGGVGPLTTTLLFANLLRALEFQQGPLDD